MMDGIHDLGGRQGFGPVAVTQDEPAFHHEWEGRMFALAETTTPAGWTIDWYRNLIELIEPRTYLTEPYFQRWLLAQMTGMVQSGAISREEALGGPAETRAPPPPAMDVTQVLAEVRRRDTSFAREIARPPAFSPGDTVRTCRHVSASHTRLPGYARNVEGRIHAHRDAHVFPDASARGDTVAQHLYTVAFSARALWGDTAHPNDEVMIDLWESYLVRA
jgi:nitrile hydratase